MSLNDYEDIEVFNENEIAIQVSGMKAVTCNYALVHQGPPTNHRNLPGPARLLPGRPDGTVPHHRCREVQKTLLIDNRNRKLKICLH